MDISLIPQFPSTRYRVDVSLNSIERNLELYAQDTVLELNPDFQRGHVWTKNQQVSYVWYLLQGGEGGREIYWNSPKWEKGVCAGPVVLVDGLQRLTAVRLFIAGELDVNGYNVSDFPKNYFMCNNLSWRFFGLQTKVEVLDWYLALNAGGTPHSQEEITRVRALRDTNPSW